MQSFQQCYEAVTILSNEMSKQQFIVKICQVRCSAPGLIYFQLLNYSLKNLSRHLFFLVFLGYNIIKGTQFLVGNLTLVPGKGENI